MTGDGLSGDGMSGSATIARATARDIEAVMTVMAEAFDPAFGEAWNAAQCLGILDLPGVSLLLAMQGEAAAGFALARLIVDEAELLLLAVRPCFRRGGVGTALLARVREDAARSGARRLHLEVRDGNPALNLYRAGGFDQVGCRRGYYRGGDGQSFDALSLSLLLDIKTSVTI